ncbi:DNA polymerase III subunit alpha [Streptococcus sp. BJSWXB6CM1]|uniref:DNA polymerase III subunit alpha n=1 Tax=Streptococcus fermentans TaxID=3095082 RepID=A0ABU5FZQ4_9STRE|nr:MULTISPECIES: DNA polymerase III subunit alpha [unclassified Streptococcus]MDY4346412.1 DNA polymerase III subunit alpha [Streptococcus sp. BJSWXB5TM5]MDY4361395.1 DNA polymerase III subunit alpha [Streptococcus sp. BJSWXB3CM3]MDY4371554.1 DNA polymerase III subunit alpha [Streptococcus sp. BJSWXB6CM1]
MIAQLDTKTVYSFMESMISIQKYVDQGKAYGYSALGIMDIDNLYGAYYFIKECQKQGIQPLLGLEVTVHHKAELINLRFLALSNRGYRNLMKLSSQKMTGKKEWTDFSPYLEDICIIVPYFQEIVNLDLGHDYYIGVYPDTAQSNFSHPILPLYRVNSFEAEDLETLQMLKAIKENVTLREVDVQAQQGLFLPADRLEQIFLEKFPLALENLARLIKEASYEIDSSLKLPRFNPERPAVEELRERARNGLQEKGLLSQPYLARLEEELSVIHDMGFDDYFLVVWDLLRFGRSQGYYMGMGRGSAVGSLVAYALDITGIDPVAKNLIFERFLNRERYTMPDIDIDIPDIYRPEFIRYVRDRYGSIHAAQIVTYSTFGAKQAIRDVFKRYGVPEYELTSITKKIGFKDTLTSAYEGNLGFRQLIQGKIEYQKAFEIAKKIEGYPRQTSIHAAGVVISDKNLTDYIPLKYGEDMLITQYDAHGVEGNGLLKMDFLGLRNLTFAQKMQELLFETQGIQLRIEDIDLEDRETLALFAAGKTKGIFQFEQPGAIRLLKRVKPQNFEEVVATTSLNRPGASDYIDNFVARKHGKEKVTVLDPVLEDILAPTYGIMLYQEQVMQVAQRYAGFSLGKADILRRAMGKKNAAEMHRMEESFIQGALEKGHGKEQAQQVFAVMEKFAGYGFNRSHAYAYAALAFQLAYFKTHYPEIFYQVMLNYASGDYILDALEMDFELTPLSINTIPYLDKLTDKTIYLGLKSIKGMPRDFAYWILENRPFSSVEDFVTRLPKNYQKLSLLTPLVEIGLFDSFEKNRQKILSNLPTLFIFVEELGSLFADNSYNWLESEDFTQVEKFRKEQEWLGVGISPHPLLILAKNPLYPIVSLSELSEGQTATVLVEIQSIRVIRTKKGENMAFLKVSDSKSNLEVTVFSDQYRQFNNLLHEGRFYYLNGKVQARDGRLQLVLNNLKEAVSERFWIQAADHEHDSEIYHILEQYKGQIPVIIRYENEQKNVLLPGYFVAKDVSLQESLSQITMKTIYR